jgi:hypothetical protein
MREKGKDVLEDGDLVAPFEVRAGYASVVL